MNRRREKFFLFSQARSNQKELQRDNKEKKTYGWDLDVLRVGEQTL